MIFFLCPFIFWFIKEFIPSLKHRERYVKGKCNISAIDCETYFSEGGCGANFVLNILLGGGASDIVNASSDNETGEVRCYIILLQNSRLGPGRNEKLASRL